MNKMELPEGMLYVGADIVDELIQSNKRKYPKHYFRVLDITQDELPKVDLMMVRDCLVHLSDADVKKALTNIKRSWTKYLLTTHFPEHTPWDTVTWWWRPINLTKPPFGLKQPIEVINEWCMWYGGLYTDKSMCLWEVDSISNDGITLEWLYNDYCNIPSDIHEHLPTLKELASKCSHVTEMWVREALSSVALLLWCDNVVSYDIQESEWVKNLKQVAPHWDFRLGDTREIEIAETDMLFIDTWHCYDQLIAELNRHWGKVRKYIVMHDTTSFGEKWEIRHEYPCTKDKYDGLNKAIDEFVLQWEWKVLKVFENNNGLTVLKRIWEPEVTVFTAIFWDYDTLKLQPEQTINCRFVCFTDNPDLRIERWAEKQREVIVADKNPDIHPRMRAKWYRTHPYEHFNGVVMYMDGTARIKRWDSVEFLTNQLKSNEIVCFRHPERDNIVDECKFITEWDPKRWKKYRWLDLQWQVDHYLNEWFPDNIWLSATGLLVHRKTERVVDFLDKWYQENVKWTYQDQISYEPMIHKNNIKRQWIELEWDIRHNDYITFLEWHLRDD